MRLVGKIIKWNDEKDFGFIRSKSDDYFVHISAFQDRIKIIDYDTDLVFEVDQDQRGRKRAINVRFAGEQQKATPSQRAFVVSVLFLSSLMLLALFKWMPLIILWAYVVMSVLTFIVYAFDKSAARVGNWRTSEANLLLLGLLCGWPGAWCAQNLLRHKSKKATFRNAFWITSVINVGGLIYLLSPYGASALYKIAQLVSW